VGALGRVVVIGNSFAGLLTASALADHADNVTIVDRDRVPDEPMFRGGVPQGRHTHVLLAAGRRTLETLLPGVLAQLATVGVQEVAIPRDIVSLQGGRWVRRTADGTTVLTGTRPLLEHIVRQRVLSDPRIAAVDAAEVVGLAGDRDRVRGVLVRRRGGVGVPGLLEADLVVDASGRGSRMPQWLRAIGAAPPDEERVEAGLAYATRAYKTTAELDYKGIYLMSDRRLPRAALVMPNEEPGAYLITLSGRAGDEPPTDPDGYEAFAAGLPHSIVREWIAEAVPQGPPVGFRNTANIRRRYDRLRDWPAGLLVVGDAACTFNPVYAQGITVAAFGAQAVKDALARGERSTAHLQRLVAAAAEQAWAIAAGADKSLPRATGNAVRRSMVDRAAGWYVRRVEAHAACNPVVGQPFLEVLELVRPMGALLGWPVLRTVLFRRVRPPLAEPPLNPEPVSSP